MIGSTSPLMSWATVRSRSPVTIRQLTTDALPGARGRGITHLGRTRPNHQDRASGAVCGALADASKRVDPSEPAAPQDEQIGVDVGERVRWMARVVGQEE